MNEIRWSKSLAEKIIRKGWPLIEEIKQEELRQLLGRMGYQLSKATISNIYRKYIKNDTTPGEATRSIGLNSLKTFSKGLLAWFKSQKKFQFDVEKGDFVPLDAFTNIAAAPQYTSNILSYQLRTHQDGRRGIDEKIEFIKDAKHEIIEMGIRLNSFSKYFSGRKDAEFKNPIINLLQSGVALKCVMMDPEAELTRIYFEDRAKVIPKELADYRDMPKILDDLIQLKNELNALDMPGKMSIHLYQHFPYYHYLTVDGNQEWGKMMYSSYIYGEKRANCPVTEIYQYGSPELYKRHWRSLQLILQKAKEI
ncbi:hypothetical protein [Haliscomenobacter sp.]|uniref:hypothetical protein n=1 Tax=Haliscomenobacter sp. TaxID=2717303 RepID=UPI003592FE8D